MSPSRQTTLPLKSTCEHIQFSVLEIEASSSCWSISSSSASRFVALPPFFDSTDVSPQKIIGVKHPIRFDEWRAEQRKLRFLVGNGNAFGIAAAKRRQFLASAIKFD